MTRSGRDALAATRGSSARRIRLNGIPLRVIGVAQRGFQGLTVGSSVDLWVPLSMQHALRYIGNYSANDADIEKPWAPQDGIQWLILLARVPPASAMRIAGALDRQVPRRSGAAGGAVRFGAARLPASRARDAAADPARLLAAARAVQGSVARAHGECRAGAAHRVRQPRRAAARAQLGPKPRGCRPDLPRRSPWPPRAPGAHREPNDRAAWRRVEHRRRPLGIGDAAPGCVVRLATGSRSTYPTTSESSASPCWSRSSPGCSLAPSPRCVSRDSGSTMRSGEQGG